MTKLEETIQTVQEQLKNQLASTTYESRKCYLKQMLKTASIMGIEVPCQELYDTFVADDYGSKERRFHLNHCIKLVDKCAGTHALRKDGMLYNEPVLPTMEETYIKMENITYPIESLDISFLIVKSEQEMEYLNLTTSTTGQYRHAWKDIYRYFFLHGSTVYSESSIQKYIDEVTSLRNLGQMKEWKWKINRKAAYVLRRVTPVRQLGKYMNGIGVPTYVLPGHIPNRQIRYEAHIYTEAELKAFFRSIDQCPKSPFSPTRCYVIPVLFRLLYCCGLRSSEAHLLKVDDVDLGSGKLIIRESKGWRARIVYMSGDLLDVCREYHAIIENLMPGREAFFPNKDRKVFSKSTIGIWFHEFWDHLPEAAAITGNPARVHDFRHVYAVDRLNRWVRENRNISALYPYLSEYMGHSNYTDTDYYLSLVESFYPEMESRLSEFNSDILPEVYHENE